MKRVLAIAAFAAFVLASCAADTSDAGDELPINDRSSDAASSSDPSTSIDPGDGIGDGTGGSDIPVVSPNLSDEVEVAVADLKSRLGTDLLIEVVVAHELTWPDGSVGCPEPGMSYTQVLVDGYRIELIADDTVFAYHGAVGEDPFLCEEEAVDFGSSGNAIVPPEVPTTSVQDDVLDDESYAGDDHRLLVAIADASSRFDVEVAAIRVVSHRNVMWSDRSLGCPSKGIEYLQVLTPGWLTILDVDGRQVEYHASSEGEPFLCSTPTAPADVVGDA